MKAIAVIPARGGSRRIPKKNIKHFHGRPIIAYSIETAQKSGLFSQVWVSTEDEKIGRIAEGYGAQWYRRPLALANDGTGTQEVVRDFLRWQLEQGEPWAFACCIYPTAPLLTVEQLHAAYTLLAASNARYVVPVGSWLEDPGQFYFGTAEAFLVGAPLLGVNTRICPIEKERAIDINTPEDWTMAELMYAKLHKGI